MSATLSAFHCASCQRSYKWKEELAGKKVKCKCGSAISVPIPAAEPTPANPDAVGLDEDGLYALVAEAEAAAKTQPVVFRQMPQTVVPTAAGASPRIPAGVAPLGYQRGPTKREKEKTNPLAMLDLPRDVYMPSGMLALGMLLSIGYYTLHYNLGTTGTAVAAVGLGMMTLVKAIFLIVFAIVVAGPLGVSFGGIWTAALKLAAVAIFTDGIVTIINLFVSKLTGGVGTGGLLTYGVIAWPIAIFTYWASFVYLFSMDAADARMVVVILAILDRIFRWIILILLLRVVMGWASVPASAVSVPTVGPAGPKYHHVSVTPDPLADHIDAIRDSNRLIDAHSFLKFELFMTDLVNNLTAHGCPHVWFEVTRDINSHPTPIALIVELPSSPSARAACLADLKAFYDSNKQIAYDPADLTDTGRPYLMVGLD